MPAEFPFLPGENDSTTAPRLPSGPLPAAFLRAAGCLVALAGGLGLSGWLLSVLALTRLSVGDISIKANTSVAFILCGLGLVLPTLPWARARLAARACAVGVGLIAGLALLEYATGRDLGFNIGSSLDPASLATPHPGRTTPQATLGFLFIGPALWLIATKPGASRRPRMLAICGVAGLALGVLGLFGHLAELPAGYLWPECNAMPVGTAALLAVLGSVPLAVAWRDTDGRWLLSRWLTLSFGGGLLLIVLTTTFSQQQTVRLVQERNLLAAGVPLYAGAEAPPLPATVNTSLLPVAALAYMTLFTLGFYQLNREVALRIKESDLQRQSADLFRDLSDNVPVLIWLSGRDGGCTYLNKNWLEFTGRSLAQEQGQGWIEGVHPEDLESCLDIYQRHFLAREKFHREYRLRRADGAYRWLTDSGVPRFDANGSFLGYVGSCIDTTNNKEIVEALRANEAFKTAILNSLPAEIVVLDANGVIVTVNDTWVAFSRKNNGPSCVEGYIGRDYIASCSNPDQPGDCIGVEARAGIESVLRGERREFRLQYPCNSPAEQRWFLMHAVPVPLKEGGCIISHMDITENVQNQERIRDLNADLERRVAERTAELAAANAELVNFKAALDAHAIVGITDTQGRITYANENFSTVSGYSREELLGRDHRLLNARHHPKEFISNLWDTILSGRVWKGDMKNRAKDGSYFWLTSTIVPFPGPDGKTAQFIAIHNDITARKTAEDKIVALNEDLQNRAARLEAANQELEAFSYSVSHDLRAPLRAVDGFSRLLIDEHAARLDDEGRRMLGVIRGEAQRMGQLIDDLLAFSRTSRQQVDPLPIDMHAMAREVFAELSAFEPDRTLRLELHPMPQALGTPAMIRQVWVNLIGNAIKFTRKRPVAEIEIGSRGNPSGGWVYYVKDNGAGFDMRYAGQLFGVFQRLHGQSEFGGTGVGLALVRRILQRHGGRVWAQAEVDRGAQFFFTLPQPKP
jgi:PAS domain S-box-containing protein